jgi:predicted transcriptional regulator
MLVHNYNQRVFCAFIKKNNASNPIEVVDIIRSFSNNMSLLLFETIAVADGRSDLLISKLNLTRKQFYSRMACLIECGLIRRKRGKYTLTSFGKIIYSVVMTIKKASECYSKLKVIDLLQTSNDYILKEELDNIINILLQGNPQIRQIVVI